MTDNSIAGRITNGAFLALKLGFTGLVVGSGLYFAGDHAYKVLSAPDCSDTLKQDFANATGVDHALVTLKNGTYCKMDFNPS